MYSRYTKVCDQAKGSGKISASKKDAIILAVHEIVKKREGEDTYQRLLETASSPAFFPQWRNIAWLETQSELPYPIFDWWGSVHVILKKEVR